MDSLMSERGRATVLETTIGLMSIVRTWALVQGAILGLAGGLFGPLVAEAVEGWTVVGRMTTPSRLRTGR
jgi:hypothetical protein